MLIKTTGRGPDYGKNLIQRRWAFLALLAVGATGLVCYFFLVPGSGISGHARGFYLGGASGITGAALANLLRNEWMLRHPERWKKARIQETDERSQRLTAQAAQLAGVATFFLQALAAFVLVAVDPMLVKVLLGSMLAYILFFLGARGRPGPAAVRTLSWKGGSPVSYPNPIPPMTEEERAAFRSFLLRRYVLSILALVLGIAGAVLLLRRGVDGRP